MKPRNEKLGLGVVVLAAAGLAACDRPASPTPAPGDGWLSGAPDQAARDERLERYLRGFDQPMWEVGERYQRVEQALRDENWPLAAYHWEKIQATIEGGLMKRPKRRANAEALFLGEPWEGLHEALESQDPARRLPAPRARAWPAMPPNGCPSSTTSRCSGSRCRCRRPAALDKPLQIGVPRMKNWWSTNDNPAIVLIRLAVGLAVFFPEGLQKLLFPEILGAGRFAGIGIPWPEFFGPFVGVVETVCGLLIILGLATRWATIPLIITMIVALVSTKLPILIGHDWWIFHVHQMSRYGFWSAQHEARTDMVMLLSLGFLLIVGSGGWSVDRWLARRRPSGAFQST